jgi:Cyclic nucleotide-binding domain/FHA domain
MVNSNDSATDPRSRMLVSFPAGTPIFAESTKGEEMYIIEDGEVEILKLHGPVERLLSTLGPGDFFGEMSLLESKPRVATARAKTDVRLLPVDASTFDQLLRDNPEITIRLLRRLSQRLRKYEEEEVRASSLAHEVLGGVDRADIPKLAPITLPEPEPAVEDPAQAAAAALYGWLMHEGTGKAFSIPPGASYAIGRFDPVTELSPEIDLGELDTQRSTSRRHARIFEREQRFFLREEIGTSNGTFVGSDRLQTGVERELADGDAVRFGRVDLVFRTAPAS